MTFTFRRLAAATCAATLPFTQVLAQQPAPAPTAPEGGTLPEVSITSILPDRLESVPGAFSIVDEKALSQRQPFSIKEALGGVSGVHVVDEDSFGLGLNIGVRGLDPRRTSRTLLLEDGMPLFLAPYGDPSAHYATPLDRLQRIEVVKGSGQILYGPQTVGGMINFVTRPVPRDGLTGSVSLSAGNHGFQSQHANLGTGNQDGGVMLDALHKRGDGVRTGHDFSVREFVAKAQYRLGARHTVVAKLGHYEERSHVSETALGLTEWGENKFQAPTGHNDRFQHDRQSVQLQHLFDIGKDVQLSTQAYWADAARASFRQINAPGENAGRSRLERCPGGVDRNNLANADLCGGRWRPRDYTYWGVEPRLDVAHQLFGVRNEAVLGVRYHREDILRRQYRGDTPAFQALEFASANSLPREDIAIGVEALSYYAQNTFHVGLWSLTPGLRVEDLRIRTDVRRADGLAHNNPESKLTNDQRKTLPGLGVAWNGWADTTVFAGVHKGFAPPRPDRDLSVAGANAAVVSRTRPEESTNWELGIRSARANGLSYDATLFRTEFDEIVINGPAAGTFVNGGKSLQSGLELAGRIDWGKRLRTPHNLYFSGAYTQLFTARFLTDDPSQGIVAGNRLPYAPRHRLSLAMGLEMPSGWHGRIGLDHVGVQFSDGANSVTEDLSGESGRIPAHTTWNASLQYQPPGSRWSGFLSVQNLTNREYLVSRVDGMVAGRQRQVFGGIRHRF